MNKINKIILVVETEILKLKKNKEESLIKKQYDEARLFLEIIEVLSRIKEKIEFFKEDNVS